MAPDEELAAIARGLTPGMRKALLEVDPAPVIGLPKMWPNRSMARLIGKGLVSAEKTRSFTGRPSQARNLTSLGMQVRAHLEKAHG